MLLYFNNLPEECVVFAQLQDTLWLFIYDPLIPNRPRGIDNHKQAVNTHNISLHLLSIFPSLTTDFNLPAL